MPQPHNIKGAEEFDPIEKEETKHVRKLRSTAGADALLLLPKQTRDPARRGAQSAWKYEANACLPLPFRRAGGGPFCSPVQTS